MTVTLNMGFGFTTTGLTSLGLTRSSKASSALVAFLKGAGDLDKYAAKLAEHGFGEVESLTDREVLDDDTLAHVIGMTRVDIRKLRAHIESVGASPTMRLEATRASKQPKQEGLAVVSRLPSRDPTGGGGMARTPAVADRAAPSAMPWSGLSSLLGRGADDGASGAAGGHYTRGLRGIEEGKGTEI